MIYLGHVVRHLITHLMNSSSYLFTIYFFSTHQPFFFLEFLKFFSEYFFLFLVTHIPKSTGLF